MKNILVTGDRGYIGSVLVPFLLVLNYKVTGLDAEYFVNGTKSLLHFNYHQITKDIRKIEKRDLQGIDAVIHLSALSNDPMGEIDKKLTEDINLHTSLKLAQMCKEIRVKRFIFSSSCSVYGIAKSPVVDETSQVNPLTVYAKSKFLLEEELEKIADSNFCVGIMRNATVYGYSPRFRNDLVVNNLVTCALALGKIKVLSNGSPWRPLIDIRDLSRALIAFLEAPKEKINGEIINVGFNEGNFRVRDIVSVIKRELPDCDIEYTNEHGSDSRSYRVNFDKFHKLFPEFKQEWPLERSVQDLIGHLKAENYSRDDFLSGKYTRMVVLKNLIERGKVDNMLYYKD